MKMIEVAMPPMPTRARAIIEEVAARHKLHPTSLVGRSREKDKVAARHEAMRLIHALDGNKFSFPRIGKMFNRDHSTVMHAIAKVSVLDSPAPSASAPRADGPVDVDTPRVLTRSSAASDDRLDSE